jgi:hypothetical protein
MENVLIQKKDQSFAWIPDPANQLPSISRTYLVFGVAVKLSAGSGYRYWIKPLPPLCSPCHVLYAADPGWISIAHAVGPGQFGLER